MDRSLKNLTYKVTRLPGASIPVSKVSHRAIIEQNREILSEPFCSNNEMLTMEEVARELRCSKAHISKIIRGRVKHVSPLPVIRMGARCIINRTSLDHWKAQNENGFSRDKLQKLPENARLISA
jgi:plasmid maintenance system antidote protein VapI